jgi:hypothetical protein
MPLKAYRNKFEHTHENEFFRFLSTELEKKWEDKKDTAYLIGNPKIIGDDGNPFYPDILFISKNIFAIMELKDYSGEITFPPGYDFANSVWKTDETIIKGGSFINPFAQVKSYRNKIRDYLNFYNNELSFDSKFNPDRIKAVVCFQKDIELSREVPAKISRWFYIKDRRNIVDWFDDVVSPEIDLTDRDLEKLVALFYNPEYEDILAKEDEPAIGDEIDAAVEESHYVDFESLTDAQKDAIICINDFVESDNQILLLTGITNSGKTHLINYIRSHIFNNTPVKQVISLAPTNRIVGHLNRAVPNIRSVYGYIYTRSMFESGDIDSEDEQEGENGRDQDADNYKIIFDLRENLDENNCIYVVDESHLISDSHFETPILKFGSGKLLNDLLTYINPKNTGRKIIFIGDKYLMGYGSRDISALSEYYLSEINGYKVISYNLKPDDKIQNNVITRGLIRPIVKSIEQKQFNTLQLNSDDRVQILEGDAVKEICKDNILNDGSGFKILTYSNEQAKTLSAWVKKEILSKNDFLEKGDLVVFFNTVILPSEDPFTMPQKIFNGEYAEVVDIAASPEIKTQKLRGRDKPIELRYRRIGLKIIERDINVKGYYLENFWDSDRNEISKDEYIAIQAYYNSLVSKRVKESITETREWKELVNSAEYKQLKSEHKELEKSGKSTKKQIADAKRKIRELELPVKRQFINKVRSDIIASDPFVNPIYLRFGYTITVHRALGNKWSNLLLNMHQGEGRGVTNEEYFRWIYSGLSRAEDKLYITNPPNISPYMNATWKHVTLSYEHSDVTQKQTPLPVHTIGEPDPKERSKLEELQLTGYPEPLQKLYLYVSRSLSNAKFTVNRVDHKDYAEHYHINNPSGGNCHLIFYYNKKYEFTKFNVAKAEPDELKAEVVRLIESYQKDGSDNAIPVKEPVNYPSNVVGEMLRLMNESLKNINITQIYCAEYNHMTRVDIKRDKEFLLLDVYYIKEGFVSIISPNKSNSEQLHDDVKKIFLDFIQGYK